jgi:hypothetical protein
MENLQPGLGKASESQNEIQKLILKKRCENEALAKLFRQLELKQEGSSADEKAEKKQYPSR